MQGDLFETAEKQGLDCDTFVKLFMNSRTTVGYDSEFDLTQWAGVGYLLEELEYDSGGLPRSDLTYGPEAMYWMGYLYRYWHFYTGESSKKIYQHVNASKMAAVFPAYHTLDCEEAIDRFLAPPEQHD